MAEILVTGGAGFIGGHLAVALLADGHTVDLLDDFSRAVHDDTLASLAAGAGGRLRLREGDILDPATLPRLDAHYDIVFHLAAIIGVAHVLQRPYDVLWKNVALLDRVLSFARTQPRLRRLVFASTSEVYAGTLQHFTLPFPTPETAPLAVTDLGHPRTSYMLSKLYGEAMCRHSGLPFTIVRPHNFYGPRMGLSHVVPELLRRAVETPDGTPFEVYSTSHRRTFCYIDDAAEMLRAAALNEACVGQTLNLGRQEPEVSIGELAEVVLRVVGRRLAIHPLPETPGSPPRRCPDMSRTIALLGPRPQLDLAEGVRRTYDWYRTHVFGGRGPSAI